MESWILTPVAAALARTLLHSLWEGAVLALLLALTLCTLRNSRARYAAACASMVVMTGGMVVTFTHLVPEQPATIRLTPAARFPATPTGLDALPSLPPVVPRPVDHLGWLLPFWIAGVLFFHARGVTSWMAARRLRGTGICGAREYWLERLDRLRARLRMTRQVALLESCLAEVPVVIGYMRPVILMPVGLLAGLPVGQVEAILLHELAHIRRYDYLVNLMQIFVEGLLFYHPAVWWVSRVIRDERENCCDDLVVSVTGSAYEFAAALTALEQRRDGPREALAATDGSLVNRVQRLLGRRERRYAMALPALTAAILTLTAVTAMAALQFASVRSVSGERGDETRAGSGLFSALQLPVRKPSAEKMPMAQAQQGVPFREAPQANQQTPAPAQPDKILFDRAIDNIEHGSYLAARLTLNKLINDYPSSEYQIGAKLAIADSWYREGDEHGRAQGEAEYRDLILFYPNSPEAKVARRTLETPYKKWLDEDIVYIVSREQSQAFQQSTTDDRRTRFVEQFWLRRDRATGAQIAQQNPSQDAPPMNKQQYDDLMRQREEQYRPLMQLAQTMALDTPYRKWLTEDVVYIISDEERKAFLQLTTDEERQKFVEQFWLRRDPTPGTSENEFKEEHYRRIAFANEHFSSPTTVGWKTDRGRIYIQYGPPDEIDAHHAGGSYRRPPSEGGGETETFPFEQWRYRYIDGIGQNLVLEFVDAQMNNEYRLTMDPHQKDALWHLPTPAAPPR
jgi:GWxTD domain-containing protein